jgi:Malectin domain
VDHNGQRWRADDYYLNGFRSSDRPKVSGTEDPELFGAERFGHFRYAIPVDRRGRYTVILHFVEFYHGPQLPGKGGIGSRIFHVFCNGQTLLRDFDIFKEAGSLRVVTRSFANITPSALGKINLDFEPVINNATLSGIEIIDQRK